MSYTKKPWKTKFSGTIGHTSILLPKGSAPISYGPFRDDHARRIVAAVNACAGIPTEELESGNVVIQSKEGAPVFTSGVSNGYKWEKAK